MGGFGSGERWSKKRAVESCQSLDTADLKRWHMLRPGITGRTGSFRWGGDENGSSVGYALTVGENASALRLMYSTKLQDAALDYSVRLVTTPCRLGGVRWWFVCPLVKNGVACGRRARKLYLSGRYFGCRRCHGLTYRSCQESDARVYTLARGGLDAIGDPGRMSPTQLCLALKALTLLQKRADRFDL